MGTKRVGQAEGVAKTRGPEAWRLEPLLFVQNKLQGVRSDWAELRKVAQAAREHMAFVRWEEAKRKFPEVQGLQAKIAGANEEVKDITDPEEREKVREGIGEIARIYLEAQRLVGEVSKEITKQDWFMSIRLNIKDPHKPIEAIAKLNRCARDENGWLVLDRIVTSDGARRILKEAGYQLVNLTEADMWGVLKLDSRYKPGVAVWRR